LCHRQKYEDVLAFEDQSPGRFWKAGQAISGRDHWLVAEIFGSAKYSYWVRGGGIGGNCNICQGLA
jgi:hypothetical protein